MTDVNVANFQNWLQMVVDLRSRASDALKVTSEGTEGNEKKFLSEIKLMLDTVKASKIIHPALTIDPLSQCQLCLFYFQINSQVKDLENKVSPASTTDNRLPLGHRAASIFYVDRFLDFLNPPPPHVDYRRFLLDPPKNYVDF